MMRRPATGFCFPGYRYCGPGCTGPGAPTNAVDNCCLNHDACYAYGYDKRYCDAIFQQCLNQYKNPSTKMGRDANLFSRAIRLKNFLI
ncbi:Parvovirus coat protein VP1-like protein [Solibacillus isronensis]|nr:Parvovirus coat protein VP1-like protein [Solibacillus isronensis]MCM3723001.1 Parvovirus coat protein VP1-like protein [Solibacillus isronensis]